jgi:hypothetical protein
VSKIIIGIHGLGNKPPEKQLAIWWKRSIREGLRAIGRPSVFFRFELVYWADLIYPQPQNAEINDPKNPFFLDDPYWPARNFSRPKNHEDHAQLKLFLIQKLKKIMLNEDKTINFKYISDALIHRYFKELEAYFGNVPLAPDSRPAREVIRKRLEAVLYKNRHKDIMLIGHSMGSIIAYDVLNGLAPKVEIDTLVTAGSPLGLPVIVSFLYHEPEKPVEPDQAIRTPESIKHAWVNFSDLEDKIAMDYHLSDDFEANSRQIKVTDQIVHTNYYNNGEHNPHKVYGYLRTAELSALIDNFLHRDTPKFLIKIKQRFNRWLSHKIEEWR